jgi:hypothetical protein
MIFMLLFGIGFFILVGTTLHDNDAPLVMSIVFTLFMIGWIATVLFILVYHIRNLKSKKGLSLIDIETESPSQTTSTESDPMHRLRMLEALKNDGLISDDEYGQKRREIIKEKW